VKYPAVAPSKAAKFLACLEGTREDPVLWLIELARALPVQELSVTVGSTALWSRMVSTFAP
jgi:hypothetical protein